MSEIVCPQCAALVPLDKGAESRTCPQCGTALGNAPPPQRPSRRPAPHTFFNLPPQEAARDEAPESAQEMAPVTDAPEHAPEPAPAPAAPVDEVFGGPGEPDAAGEPDADAGEDVFGAYELIDRLGASDIAVSYRARDRRLGKMVVLKVLAPGACSSIDELASVRERARASRKLRHPNIVTVVEIGAVDGTDYVVHEFVQGHPLSALMEAGALSVGEAVILAGTLASALEHAHTRGVIHGDVRPANVIMDNSGNPVITDFGFAREYWRVQPDELKRGESGAIPLPHYMSPEQLRGGEPAPASDVYGLGALLYHMLTGRTPFPGRSLLQVTLEVDRGRPATPSAIDPMIPAAVSAMVMKCLEKDPLHRYRTAGELAKEIEKFLRGQRVNARLPGAWDRLKRQIARRWKAGAAVVALAAMSSTGAFFAARKAAGEVGAAGRIAEAVQLLRAGHRNEASERLRRIAGDPASDPADRSRASEVLGLVAYEGGDFGEAVSRFREAIQSRPNEPALHYYEAMALWSLGERFDEVASALRRSMDLDPVRAGSARYQYEYGRALREAGQHETARAAFLRARELDPAFEAEAIDAHLRTLPEHRR